MNKNNVTGILAALGLAFLAVMLALPGGRRTDTVTNPGAP